MEQAPYQPDGQVELLKRQLADARRQLREQSIVDAGHQEVVRAIETLVPALPEIRTPKKLRNIGRVPVDALLHLSDIHYGEVVRSTSTNGLAQYSPDIARERIEEATDRTIEIAKSMKVGKLVVVQGGDMVSGLIHDDLERSNAEMVVQQSLEMGEITSDMIRRFGQELPYVEVDGRSGNHGRPYRPMFFNRKQVENFDFFVYKYQEAKLSNAKHVKFLTNESFWNVVSAGNRKFLTMHGDTIKHANSMSLPWYSMYKELLKWMSMREDGNVPSFNDMLIGHFHNPASIQMGESTLRVAPAVKGADDYSYAGSRIPVPAGARLMTVAEGQVQYDHIINLDDIGRPHLRLVA